MKVANHWLSTRPRGAGLHEITAEVTRIVDAAGVQDGLATLFIQHTSASLLVQENADPSARRDLEAWLDRLVPEHDPLFTHTLEGPDDMPAHVKAGLLGSSVTVPIRDGRLCLGTWQGIYLCEHRDAGGPRRIVVTIHGE
jgi:secondary thiamine-phosphate synthase enzyme